MDYYPLAVKRFDPRDCGVGGLDNGRVLIDKIKGPAA
jgi:hypothetical protein